MHVLPATRSLLASNALAAELARVYVIGEPVACVLWRAFTNDVYRLTTTTGAYFVKVYGPGWRSASDVAYEVDLLQHLQAHGIAVAAGLPCRDGRPCHVLPVPEGQRYCAVFVEALGREPVEPFTAALYYDFGRAAAAMHAAADSFTSAHQRFRLDLSYLIDRPLAAIEPYLAHRPDDCADLTRLAARVRDRIDAFAAAGLDWGPCHGDLTLDCFRIGDDNRITFYDFDSGGPGWRSLEFQGIYAYAASNCWDAFRTGYTEVRPLSANDLAAIPWFVPVYGIFDMGWGARHWAAWSGQWRVDDAYWDEKLGWLPQWEARHLDGA